jgi:hypothetical protein
MTQKTTDEGKTVGATIPDLVWRILSNRYASLALAALILLCVALVSFGVLDLSWGEKGLRLSAPAAGDSRTDVIITGPWNGTAQDDPPEIRNATTRYSYCLEVSFEQSRSKVTMKGHYTVNERPDAPIRQVSGHGVLHGDFLSLDYDIETHLPDANTHGVMLLHFEPSGKIAKGRFITRSMLEDGMTSGMVQFIR